MDEAFVACRLIHFASTMAAFGGSAFRLYAVEAFDPDVLVLLDARLQRLLLLASILALSSALLFVPLVGGRMAGTGATRLDWDTLSAVLLSTNFGRVWRWRLLLSAVLVGACCCREGPQNRKVIVILSGLLLASLALVGHAAMDEGVMKIAHTVNDGLHLLAAGLWSGGLLPLLWLVNRARRASEIHWRLRVRAALPPFSQMGYYAVAALAFTGMVNTLLLVGNVNALFATPYGRLLALKILLFLLMVAAAFINRYRLSPRLAAETATPYGLLWRSVLTEQALGFAIIAVVSLLGTLPPAIHTPIE